MLDTVAAVARAIGFAGRFIAVNRATHGTIGNGVDIELKAKLVAIDADLVPFFSGVIGIAQMAGAIGIRR